MGVLLGQRQTRPYVCGVLGPTRSSTRCRSRIPAGFVVAVSARGSTAAWTRVQGLLRGHFEDGKDRPAMDVV